MLCLLLGVANRHMYSCMHLEANQHAASEDQIFQVDCKLRHLRRECFKTQLLKLPINGWGRSGDRYSNGQWHAILQELHFDLTKNSQVFAATKHLLHGGSLLIMILSMNTIIKFSVCVSALPWHRVSLKDLTLHFESMCSKTTKHQSASS
jgi:hypothetical protein